MKKRVMVQDLRIGMYVSELDRPWRETPFLFQGFEIRTDEELAQLRRLCRYVYIETPDEPAAVSAVSGRRVVAGPPRLYRIEREPPAATAAALGGFEVLEKFHPGRHHEPRYPDRVSLEEEMPRAREVEKNTRTLIYSIMDDVRLGRSLDSAGAKRVVAEMVESILSNPDALICLTQLKNKDEYTALHSLRVAILALSFGRHLELAPEALQVLGLGALLHDIGKLKVPAEILNKPGRLTEAEFEIMKRHVPFGVEILERTPGIPAAAIDVARYHHERYDGSGYTSGIPGEAVGLFGAIGAIVDCYDAITSDRAYHAGLSAYEALGKMYEWRRKDFHPRLVEQFIQCLGIFPIGSVVELNTGAVGVVVSVNRQRRLKPRIALVLNADKQPLSPSRIIDLMDQTFQGPGRELEIRRVLRPGAFGINSTQYLPIAV
jgi:putative nucleotidyltransferase with HDIG domain